MSLMDDFYDSISPDIDLGYNKKKNVSGYYGEQLAAGNNVPIVPPTTGVQRLKTRKNMMDEILPVDTDIRQVASPQAGSPKSKTGSNFTGGDILGMASTVGGAIAQVSNTISAAKATKKNVNRFKGFNNNALAANAQAEVQAGENTFVQKRAMERDLKLASNTQKSRLRNLSSGVNQLKATDMATDYNINESKIRGSNALDANFGNVMMQLLGQKGQLLSQKDQMEMSGQERVDDKDQQDLDNFYSNMATNITGISEAGQKFGSDLNQAKYRRDFLSLLPDTNAWGIGAGYSKGGLMGDLSLMMEDTPPKYSSKRHRVITEEKI